MKILSLVFVLALLMTACNNSKSSQKSDPSMVIENVGEIVLNVEGMTCEGCEKTIETSLMTINGVMEVKANHETGITTVKADTMKVHKHDLAQKIEKVGYHVR